MEVELKLFLSPNHAVTELRALNLPSSLEQYQQLQLGNAYFDTPELTLRDLDMGLRIRTFNGQSEQTLKTAGKVEGGLHSRPEYNTPIDGAIPQLALFPEHIWPSATREHIQSALAVQFHTNFTRQQAQISLADGTQVELALDRGQIKAGGQQCDIAELELELINGAAKALLPLTRLLMQQWPLRLGRDSKAARGYRLAGLAPEAAICWPVGGSASELLTAWQRNEERILAGKLAAALPLAQQLIAIAEKVPPYQQELQHLANLLTGEQPQKALLEALEQHWYGLAQLALLDVVLASD